MQVMINLCLTILEKNRRNEIKIFSRKCNSIMNNANYQEARVKLSNTQLNKLKSAAKNKTATSTRRAGGGYMDKIF